MRVRWYSSSSAGVSRCPRLGTLRVGYAQVLGSRWGGGVGVAGRGGRENQGRWVWTHHSSSARSQRKAARARHRPRRANEATMADPRAGNPALGQRSRGEVLRSALTAPSASRRAPRESAAPARDCEGAGPGKLSQEGPSPTAAPVSAPAARPAPGPHRPSWGSRTPGGVAGLRALPGPPPPLGPRPSAINAGLPEPGAGLPRTWSSPSHLARAWGQHPSP